MRGNEPIRVFQLTCFTSNRFRRLRSIMGPWIRVIPTGLPYAPPGSSAWTDAWTVGKQSDPVMATRKDP